MIQDTLNHFSPKEAHEWLQLLVFDVAALVLILGGFFAWLVRPLKRAIKKEREERLGAIEDEQVAREEADAQEREARKAADAHRDDRGRDMAREMQTAVGRTEILERKAERAEDDRSVLHERLTDVVARRDEDAGRLRDIEVNSEKALGEVRTQMAQMETRLTNALRAAVQEVAHQQRNRNAQ